MIRLINLKAPLDYSENWLMRTAARTLGVPAGQILRCELAHRSVDARRKDSVSFSLSVDISLRDSSLEQRTLSRLSPTQGGVLHEARLPVLPELKHTPRYRPVVVGFGPAGIFASLLLAEAGLCPIVLERGKDADSRIRDVEAYWSNGNAVFSPVSNVQFGEGGAGTFSDGKLNTGIKDPWAAYVLRTFVRFGAPSDLLIDSKPHIGTDRLTDVVKSMRAYILSLGGEVRFQNRVTDLVQTGGHIEAILCEDNGVLCEIPASHVVLAVGHSARDTFQRLYDSGFTLSAKPFSIGARIEHPQKLIDRAQYGRFAGHPSLGPADYKLSCHLPSGRGVYTFCMCPGGEVVAAASEPDTVVTNGMSRFARDGRNANSALLVGIDPSDFGSSHPLAGMYLQRRLERDAFIMAGSSGRAPCQRLGSLLGTGIGDSVIPSYRPGVEDCDLSRLLPGYVLDSMKEAIPLFGRRIRGFDSPGAALTGPETRSSSPVRMPRNAQTESIDVCGLHPCGEGAGFAGGITSAAVDGLRCARAILEELSEAV